MRANGRLPACPALSSISVASARKFSDVESGVVPTLALGAEKGMGTTFYEPMQAHAVDLREK